MFWQRHTERTVRVLRRIESDVLFESKTRIWAVYEPKCCTAAPNNNRFEDKRPWMVFVTEPADKSTLKLLDIIIIITDSECCLFRLNMRR